MRIRTIVFSFIFLMLPMVAFASAVNINTAEPEQIASVLEGVGPVKAASIVAYREANGPFKSVDELTHVRGIGTATVETNRDRIALE